LTCGDDRLVGHLECGFIDLNFIAVFTAGMSGVSLSINLDLDFGFLNSLHAIGAFFHHPAHPNGNVGILSHGGEIVVLFAERTFVQFICLPFVPIEEIESPYLVRAVVGAIPGTNATIVGHCIETFFIVDGSVYWAYAFTWSGFAMHA
jgi:hypothetical protein